MRKKNQIPWTYFSYLIYKFNKIDGTLSLNKQAPYKAVENADHFNSEQLIVNVINTYNVKMFAYYL